jgi:TonB family protein
LKKSPEAYESPKPLKEVQPSVSPSEAAVTHPVPVEVRVFVTESGSVDFAELMSDGNNPRLAAAAISAARKWNFAPAKMGGENVPGEMILHFRFEPGADAR